MALRATSARLALTVVLAAVSLPFLALAKPPDLPVRSTVECEEKPPQQTRGSLLLGVGVNSDAGLQGTIVLNEQSSFFPLVELFLSNPDFLEELKGLFCPGIDDLVESCWRALLKRVPVTCAPGCQPWWVTAEEAYWRAVFKRGPVTCAPGYWVNPTTRVNRLLTPGEKSGIEDDELFRQFLQQFREWAKDPEFEYWILVMADGQVSDSCPVERLTVMPTPVPRAAVCESSTPPDMCPIEENWMPYADEHCPRCCKQHAAPQRLSGVVQAAATEPAKPEKRSAWPRIKIELTIEIK